MPVVAVAAVLTIDPDTATFLTVAPVLEQAIFPLEGLLAWLAIRTYMVVEATEPELGAKFMADVPKPEPEVEEISKPVGGVTTKLAVKLLPETVNDC